MVVDNPVLIVGGGLVGLSGALFLERRGVPALVVEQHRETSLLPKGRGLNVRSMELYRAAGVEEALRSAPPSVLTDLPEIIHAGTLAGPEHFRASRPPGNAFDAVSPTSPLTIDQNVVEQILREQARLGGADLRFGTRLVGFEQDETGVTARVRDQVTGEELTVRTRYLIAADGHRSSIRESMGVGTTGAGSLTYYVNIPFEADLSEPLRGRRVALCYLDRPAPNTILARLDRPDRWILMVTRDRAADLTEDGCLTLIRDAVGMPGIQARVSPSLLDEDGRPQTWELASWVADRFRAGQVLLAGDAAHVMPPAGGLGGNIGIQDAYDLAWKLAAVLHGSADARLLDTYEVERRPVAEVTSAYAVDRQSSRAAGVGDGLPQADPLALVLGHRYRSAAIISDTGEMAGPQPPSREFTGRPGSRAPHLMLLRDGVPVSTLDLYGRGFVLVAGERGDRWEKEARRLRLPAGLDVHRLGAGLDDPAQQWAAAHGVTEFGAVLVRPDGYVCWRAADDRSGGLDGVFDQVLGRNSTTSLRAAGTVLEKR